MPNMPKSRREKGGRGADWGVGVGRHRGRNGITLLAGVSCSGGDRSKQEDVVVVVVVAIGGVGRI